MILGINTYGWTFQVRNVADTDLQVKGENASNWMAKAQCFAGPPEDPPAPGTRVVVRSDA